MSELTPTAYPIVLSMSRPLSSGRFWAIPLIGVLVKGIILIPHLIILYVLGIVMGAAHVIIWLLVLLSGRYPDWAFGLTAGYVRWAFRVAIYFYGLTDSYPAFSMDAPGDVAIGRPESSSRFFAIPFIGIFVRWLILIPHLIILYALGIAIGACQMVIWIPVLFAGRYPNWAFSLVSGTILWSCRVYAYLLGLTDRYPPFSLT